MISVIVSKFTFFNMQIERMLMHPSELSQADFTKPPKIFNPVDMAVSIDEFVFAMFDSVVLFVAKVSQSVYVSNPSE